MNPNGPFGRVLLHVACALRDHHWRWHWAGVLRELRASISHNGNQQS